ncbi:MAG: CBS domain-containing protein [Cytophagales bacterium]|jgi:putative hemolysin|nr:CBS domain-containing protein [Cytophagales bacterium]
MTNRADITFINIENNIETIKIIINKDLHRVYPIYEGDKDKLLGIITLKDLYLGIQQNNFSIRDFIKPAQYLDESTSAYKALEVFKNSKIHYALVTNEYGLVLGLITLDDILKALVGDFSDFYTEDFSIVEREDGSWIVDAQFPLIEFVAKLQLDNLPKIENVNTVGGLVLKQLNHIPKSGEKVVIANIEIEVIDLDGIAIDKVIVKKIN